MYYIDSNIFIYAANSSSENHAACKNIMFQIAEGKIQAFTSALTWDEFFWITKRNMGRELAKIESSRFLDIPKLKLLGADESIVRSAQKLTESSGLDPRDAIHAATAISQGIRHIISDDPDFDAVAQLKRIPIESFGKE